MQILAEIQYFPIEIEEYFNGNMFEYENDGVLYFQQLSFEQYLEKMRQCVKYDQRSKKWKVFLKDLYDIGIKP